MKNENRISEAQGKFLRELRDAPDTLAVIKHQHGLSEKRFSRWLGNRFFRAELRRVMRQIDVTRQTVIVLSAKAGAELLEKGVREGKAMPLWFVFAVKVLNELATGLRKGRRLRSRKKVKLDAERALCHPSSVGRRGELLEGLEKG